MSHQRARCGCGQPASNKDHCYLQSISGRSAVDSPSNLLWLGWRFKKRKAEEEQITTASHGHDCNNWYVSSIEIGVCEDDCRYCYLKMIIDVYSLPGIGVPRYCWCSIPVDSSRTFYLPVTQRCDLWCTRWWVTQHRGTMYAILFSKRT